MMLPHVLSRMAGEEGAPTQLGEVRECGVPSAARRSLISPLLRNGPPLLPLEEREKTFSPTIMPGRVPGILCGAAKRIRGTSPRMMRLGICPPRYLHPRFSPG
jgi:hypothetical protein